MNKNRLILMKGLPGSGKSHTAAKIAASLPDCVVFSTDEFFMKDGVYTFQRKFLGDAHHWNQMRFQRAVENLTPNIIIDNTNVTISELKNYSDYAHYQGYDLTIAEPTSEWWLEHRHMFYSKKANRVALRKFAQLLGEKNTHGVPFWSIERMIWKWQETSVSDLLKGL